MLVMTAPASAAKQKPCKDAGLVPTAADQMTRVESATRCLVSRERTKRGLKRLKFNSNLKASADYQADDMLKHKYFDHTRPGGRAFADRILDFGYDPDRSGYGLGENLAWASASIAAPRKMVGLWMRSPAHRKNILTRKFRDQAVSALWSNGGVGGAYEDSNGPFVIFVNQFGVRL
jgi:uncharacterized protein YkwD